MHEAKEKRETGKERNIFMTPKEKSFGDSVKKGR